MKILAVSLGTRGDVEPVLALAKALKRRGHEVTLCGPDNFRDWVEGEHGVPFHPLSIDFKELMLSPVVKEACNVERAVQGQVLSKMPEVLAGAAASVRGGVDLVLCSVSFPGGPDLAEAHRAALVTCAMVPVWRTKDFPFFMLPVTSASRFGWLNKASYLLPKMHRVMIRSVLMDWRRDVLHLSNRVPMILDMGCHTDGTVAPRMCCISPSIIPQPDDWDTQTHMTGYWHLDAVTNQNWAPGDALASFLNISSNKAIVYIGFGSMTKIDPLALAAIVVPAVRDAGVRAVLALGWSGSAPRTKDDVSDSAVGSEDVYCLQSAPHGSLFPLLAGVVHHGGAGTTAAGLTAGVPTLVCPIGADQWMWGQKVHSLGCGPAPVALAKLTSVVLAAKLRELVGNASFHEHASELAKLISREDGLTRAVQVVEDEGQRCGKMPLPCA